MARKALITGGAGFIGSHLSELLVGDGWEVYALDDLSTGSDANVFQLAANSHLHLTVDLIDEPAASGQIYNVGSTESVTILELAERIIRLTDSSSELVFVPYEEVYGHGVDEMFQRQPAIDKIREAIDWEPTYGLDEILAEVVLQRDPASSPGVRTR